MPLRRTSVITILLLLCIISPSTTTGQDIGVRGGSEPAEPKKPAATRRATPRQPTRTSAPAPTKPKRRATLTIVTDPSECEVYLNDAYRGTTAMSNGKLVIPDLDTAAKYTLRVYRRDTGEEIQTLALEEDRELTISLKKQETATNQQPEKPPEKLPEKQPEKTAPEKIAKVNTTESRPPEKEPAETKPPEIKPAETKIVDTKPIDTKPVETTPVEAKNTEPKNTEPKNTEPKAPAVKPPQSQMALIPQGEFFLGRSKGIVIENEKPQHKVSMRAFYIDVFEVTNAEYKLFCDTTGRPYPKNPGWDDNYFLGKPNYPVLNVSFEDADSYAKWVGKRLPTEEEWEKAARGVDGRAWPWGEDFQPGFANLDGKEDGFEFAAPVGSFSSGISIYGVQDMVGNVWEWTSSPYKPYPGSQDKDKRYLEDYRVIRGGGFQAPVKNLRSAAFRFPSEPNKNYEATGFRCAKDF